MKIVNDSAAGWAGSLGLEEGINLVAGTGSIAYGQNKFGTEARAGGWDDGFSDEGSCYWLGKKALELFSKESDGRVKKGKLLEIFRYNFNLKNDFDLIDIFDEVYKLLQKHPVYLCVSYDTDLLAVENIFGYTKRWVDFAERHTDLKIEIRTKSSCEKFLKEIAPSDNIIFAFTMSPDEIISKFEHKTASLDSRISCIELALDKGVKTRIAFDPMIYCKNWKSVYTDMFDKITGRIDLNKLLDSYENL